jgi:tetratricopeptide (TPR) repeat protein
MKSVLQNCLRNCSTKHLFKYAILFNLIAGQVSCKTDYNKEKETSETVQNAVKENEIASRVNDTLNLPLSAIENYNMAREAYLKNSDDPDKLIWYGRRTAYLGKYQDAVAIYSEGIQKHPEDARMYRHRGHRYISLRQYEKAIRDFEFAVRLIEGQMDQVEPDGLPNSKNIPLSTLHGNIYYHLGLAYYLKNDMENALRAFSNRTVTEKYDDNTVSGGHWLYLILRRMGNKSAANAAIEKVVPDMDIIENTSYYKMCLFYKGLIEENELVPEGTDASSNDVYSYGLGNWYLYHKKDTVAAKKHYQDLLKNGSKFSFAYIAAEADWQRLFMGSNGI